MRHVVSACFPRSDVGFAERVRQVIAQDRGDLATPAGVALLQAVLRQTYEQVELVGDAGVWAGGLRRTIVFDVYRDGRPATERSELRWVRAVYDRSGADAYRAVVGILGEGRAAERVVEEAFRELRPPAVGTGRTVDGDGAAVVRAAVRLANVHRTPRDSAANDPASPNMSSLRAGTPVSVPLRRGPVRRTFKAEMVRALPTAQREALALCVLEDLKVSAIADRMQATTSVVRSHLRDALLAVDAGLPLSVPATLARWRAAQRQWAALPLYAAGQASIVRTVGHTWLDYQVASGAIPSGTEVLITDRQRRFVGTSSGAASLLGRASLIGLQIDDVTADYSRTLVPDLWSVFDANGSMSGEYDCDRPQQDPIRIPFRGVWGRPIPDLQVGYLGSPMPTSG